MHSNDNDNDNDNDDDAKRQQSLAKIRVFTQITSVTDGETDRQKCRSVYRGLHSVARLK